MYFDRVPAPNPTSQLQPELLRKANKLWISGPAIRTHPLLSESLHDDQPPGLIEANTLLLHHALHLPFAGVIDASASIARLNVAAEIEGAAVQAGSGVGVEVGVEICGDGIVAQVEWIGKGVERWNMREPGAASQVED